MRKPNMKTLICQWAERLDFLCNWLCGFLDRQIIHLAIVRRYCDANGNYVGELYMYDVFAGIGSYRLVGCSLDNLAFDSRHVSLRDNPRYLDLANDFLAPIDGPTIRVGAVEPKDTNNVRTMIARLPRRNVRFVIQNKFIEHVLEGSPKGR